jgi:hypothetical protein
MKYGPLWLTQHKSGKLQGFLSINTSTTSNPFCQSNATEVCRHCYAKRLEAFRPNATTHFLENGNILSSAALDPHGLPSLDTTMPVRFNSFGELINGQHLENLYTIAWNNPGVRFALFTKLDELVDLGSEPPSNVRVLKSWGSIDGSKIDALDWLFKHPRFDRVFMVDSEDKGQINCQRRCIECMWCYEGTGPIIIRELLRR